MIGLVTLFGAAVGLMNIMLVSVTERTREIGVRKAIGAKPQTIKNQFLFESILIGQMGGVLELYWILIGNIVSSVLKSSFVVPGYGSLAESLYALLLVLFLVMPAIRQQI